MRFRPLTYSLLLHLFIIVLLFVSLPFSWRVTTEETPIIVEFVDVKSSRNLNSKSNPQARKIEKSWVNQKVAKTPKQVTKNKPMAKPVPAKPTQNEKPQAKDKAKNSNEKPAIVPLKNKVQPVKKPLAPPKKEVSKAKTENISANKKTEIKNKPQPVAQGKVLKNLDVSKTKKDI
jgi:outer membrane biosynthesis protein TonB